MSLGMRELGIRKVSAWDETGYIRRNAHDQVTRIKKFFATYLKRKKLPIEEKLEKCQMCLPKNFK